MGCIKEWLCVFVQFNKVECGIGAQFIIEDLNGPLQMFVLESNKSHFRIRQPLWCSYDAS